MCTNEITKPLVRYFLPGKNYKVDTFIGSVIGCLTFALEEMLDSLTIEMAVESPLGPGGGVHGRLSKKKLHFQYIF